MQAYRFFTVGRDGHLSGAPEFVECEEQFKHAGNQAAPSGPTSTVRPVRLPPIRKM